MQAISRSALHIQDQEQESANPGEGETVAVERARKNNPNPHIISGVRPSIPNWYHLLPME